MVNVNDYDVPIPEGDMLEVIFDYQRHLMWKYHGIEEANIGDVIPSSGYHSKSGMIPYAGPLDINDRASQLRLKDFCWRITEELTEATECLDINPINEVHLIEELIDALHFHVELLCLSDIHPHHLGKFKPRGDKLTQLFHLSDTKPISMDNPFHQTSIKTCAFNVIQDLGKAANTLKLKPWKTTPMLTDVPRYKELMRLSFLRLIVLLDFVGLNAEKTCKFYLNKNAVNQFRIGSAY